MSVPARSIAQKCEATVTGKCAMEYDLELQKKKRWGEWSFILIATLIMSILNLVLLGLPSAFFLEMAQALLHIDPQNCLGADVWPLAILVALLSPLALPRGYAIARPLAPDSRQTAHDGRVVLARRGPSAGCRAVYHGAESGGGIPNPSPCLYALHVSWSVNSSMKRKSLR